MTTSLVLITSGNDEASQARSHADVSRLCRSTKDLAV